MYEDATNSINEMLLRRTPVQNLLYTVELEPNSYTRTTEFNM